MLNAQDPKIIELYKTLPQALKDALWAEETINNIFDAGRAQHLTVAQMGELADAVGLVILGLLKPDDFGYEIQRKLNVSKEQTDKVVATLNEKIFAPLRDEILSARSPSATGLPAESSAQAGKTSGVSPVLPALPDKATLDVGSSIFAKQVPSPAQGGQATQKIGYTGRDPYHEPIDSDHPETLIMKPTMPLPQKPTAQQKTNLPLTKGEHEGVKEAELTSPNPSFVSLPANWQAGRGTQDSEEPRSRPLSWSDISPEKEKASSRPDARSALERAMNAEEGVSKLAPPKTSNVFPSLRSSSTSDVLPAYAEASAGRPAAPKPTSPPSPAKISEINLGGQAVPPLPKPIQPPPPPSNLPTENIVPEKTNTQKYSGTDPYREPL